MKHLLQITFLLLSIVPATAIALNFEVDGIYYVTNGNQATVSAKNSNAEPYAGDLIIPETVTYGNVTYTVTAIGASAFAYCNELNSVTIPNTVTSIGKYAFNSLVRLKSVNLPNSIKHIGENAFVSCMSMAIIDNALPDSIVSVGEGAFHNCQTVQFSYIPSTLVSIAQDAFSGCSSVTNLTVASDNPKYDSRDNCHAIIETASNTLITGFIDTTIPTSVTAIGNYAFSTLKKRTSIDIPNSVTSIGFEAFYACEHLTSIVIPNSVTSMGNMAFCMCVNLTSVTIGNSLKEISYYAFDGCDDLTDVIIPNSIIAIHGYAFRRCLKLASITIPSSVSTIDDNAFRDCYALDNVYSMIPDPSAINMGNSVFARLTTNYEGRVLHVPSGSSAAYQSDPKWSDYFGIIAEPSPIPGDVDGSGTLSINDVTLMIDMLLGGGESPEFADFNADGVFSIKDVTDLIDLLLSSSGN